MMKMIRCSARPSGALLLGLLLAGCSSVPYDDPINPKRPFAFPGQAGTSPAVVSAQPAAPAETAAAAAVPVAVMPVIPGSTPAVLAAPGAQAAHATPTVLRSGDTIVVSFSELPYNAPLMPITVELGEDGKITLHHNVSIHALGKTTRQLEQEIRGEYVPKFYKYLTITVRPEMRYYHVNGEVKQPSMYPWKGDPTVLRAIGAAGGFTDWGRRWQVQLIRSNGQKFTVNCKKAQKDPTKDLPVYPGDYINVPRKNFIGI